MSFFRDNLSPRLRLLRTALTRRFVYGDVVAMARDYGMDYLDLRADTEPIAFARELLGPGAPEPPPDFANLIEAADKFTPPGAPAKFNSEPSVARFLGQLVFYRRAPVVFELGCFVGWTTAHMALALSARGGGRLHAVDASAEYLAVMLANLRRHHLDGFVTTVRGFSTDEAVLRALPPQADVIFLDTSHSYPATLNEINLYAPRLAPGGYFVLHDSTCASGVRRSVAEATGFRVLTFATEHSNGVTVLRRP